MKIIPLQQIIKHVRRTHTTSGTEIEISLLTKSGPQEGIYK
jgi:hypothetical protein